MSVKPSSGRPPPPFDVAIVTGFLGAGKTTLLNRLLADPALVDTLVLINEFGSVGLDHLLIEQIDGDMVLMNSGCLCCSIRGDLVATLEDVLRRRDNGRMTPFRRVLIETTGLADPVPVLHAIMAHPYLRLRLRIQTVVTLVDGLIGGITLDRHPEAVKQVAMADRLFLSKTDLVTEPAALEALCLRLRVANPVASLLVVAEVKADGLFSSASYDPATLGADATTWLADEALDRRSHGHDQRHEHDANGHDVAIRAFCLRDPRPASPHAVALFTELLSSAHGSRLLRFKGLIALEDDLSRPLVVHGVRHIMHPPERLAAWPDGDRQTRMVFILHDLDPAFVEGLWRAAKGEPRLDESDLATRHANPLAPSLGGLLA